MTCWAAGSRSRAPTRGELSRRSTGSCCRRPGRKSCPPCWSRFHSLAEIAERDPHLRHIHYDWLDAAERTQATVRQLSEQLRRFLDDQIWFENRRVIDILRGVEARALRLRGARSVPVTMELDASSPTIRLPLERPLYAPVKKVRISSGEVRDADQETDPAVLFEQFHVDPVPLAGVREALRGQPTVGLKDLVAWRPIQQGVAELIAYLSLKDEMFRIVYDEEWREQIAWSDQEGTRQVVTLRRVSFARIRLCGQGRSLPVAVTQLMKGVVYRDTHDRAWSSLLDLQPQARDYLATLGLQVVVDEAEGYAFCRQREPDPDDPGRRPG